MVRTRIRPIEAGPSNRNSRFPPGTGYATGVASTHMKHFLRITLLFLLAFAFTSCIFGGGAASKRRTLGHVYQDAEGFHILTLFETGSGVSGTARIIGKNEDRPLLVTIAQFDQMWASFDEEGLASYKVKDAGRFNAADNYVITMGHQKKGTTQTYVIPHAEAPASLTAWVDEFRAKAGN